MLYSLPDLPKSSTTILSQARNAHTFAITPFTSTLAKKKSQANLNIEESAKDVEDDEKVTKDLLVVGCRKKVVVYGAGRGGLKDAWVSREARVHRTG